ncbi:MAG: YbaK/EbsC family protein [Holosporaceae bacterium]|jgi:prolyl-tRNA editing enzyme YbaK/EbsC (Cys-tRNA(Pro) deacylase)|nr:YbaK/EbsC family protein [Holosporaceae bacterium]
MSAYERIISKLKENGVDYKIYSHETLLSSGDAYERGNLEFDVENGFKTLAFQICDRFILVVLHGRDRLDYKKICEILCIKRKDIKVASAEWLENHGYTSGGISPIPVTENARVIVDSKILEYTKIVCGSGDGEKTIEINTPNLLNITSADVHKIAKDV